MAYEFGVKEGIKKSVLESWNGMASWDWYYGFMKRHPRISLRTSKQISLQRAKGFNKENVEGFYRYLGKVYDEFKFPRENIRNMDETSFPTVPAHVQKLLARKGSKRVGHWANDFGRAWNECFLCTIPICENDTWHWRLLKSALKTDVGTPNGQKTTLIGACISKRQGKLSSTICGDRRLLIGQRVSSVLSASKLCRIIMLMHNQNELTI